MPKGGPGHESAYLRPTGIHVSVIVSSAQFKMVSMHPEKPICAPRCLPEVSPTLLLKLFQITSRLTTARLTTAHPIRARLTTARLMTSRLTTARLNRSHLTTARLITSRLTTARPVTARLTTVRLKPTDFFLTAITLCLRVKRIKDSIRINRRVFIRHKITKNNKAIQHANVLIRSKETT